MTDRSLKEVLIDLGLKTTSSSNGAKLVIGFEGQLFEGRAHEVWAWLRETGRLTPCCDATRKVVGIVTHHYLCSSCGRPS